MESKLQPQGHPPYSTRISATMSRSETPPSGQRWRVPKELHGARLDAVLAQLDPEISRTRWKTWIQEGRVSVRDEEVRRPNRIMNGGEELTVRRPGPAQSTDSAGRVIEELNLLHDDEAIAVVDKPAGLVVHPNERHGGGGTLADLLRARFGDLPSIQGEYRAGIVHRLDRLTSGVMVVGKTEAALADLKRQFQERVVEKRYLAVVHEEPRFASDWIESRIAPEPRNPRRMRVLAPESEEEGREASTYYEVLERYGCASLLECRPKTGRTHQIRVHLASIGLPIVGDRIYKHPGALRTKLPDNVPGLGRQALHARQLSFAHPVSGETLTFEAKPPEDFERLVEFLRSTI